MTDSFVLALDMGSGSAKAALISIQAEIVASAARPITTHYFANGGAEQCPEEWWQAVIGAAQEVVHKAGVPAERIIAVACTTQWAVTVPVDRKGHALHNALSWMDTRGGPSNRTLVEGWPQFAGYNLWKLRQWVKLAGGAPTRTGVDGLGHILFFKKERPDLYRETYKFLEPMDYLNLRLTGRYAASYGTIFPYWVTDNRCADRVRYDSRLLRLAGIDPDKLPELLPVDTVLGTLKPEVADLLGLSPETRVIMGSCDGHSAAIGAGTVRDFDGYFYIGTSAWMSCHVPWKKTDLFHMITTGPSALPGRYVVMAEQGMAGRCLELLKDNLLFPHGDETVHVPQDVYGYLNRLAGETPAGSDGLIFTPWVNGVLVPGDDPFTRSAFFNQNPRTGRAQYVRAVMEGVAFNLRWLKTHVEKFIGRPFDRLRFIGGGALSDVWCQITADVLNCQVDVPAEPRMANARGAALAAFHALGKISPDAMPGLVPSARTYKPEPQQRNLYEHQFEHFLACYRRMKPIYRNMNAPRSDHLSD